MTTTIVFTCFDIKGWNKGSLLLTLTISVLTLHSWLFIETHSNGFTLDKQPKTLLKQIFA